MKYTIVYSERFKRGSHSVTKYARVETDNLKDLIALEYSASVWFVFEGWPKEQGETEVDQSTNKGEL